MGKPAARIGDMHVCPMFDGPKPHVGGPISGPCVPTVLIGGMPAAVMGDMCVCVGPPDTIVLGSTGVLIGGKPAARMGDQCAHGGMIVMGCPTVLIGEVSGGGGGGVSIMPVNVLLEVVDDMPIENKTVITKIISGKKSAEIGSNQIVKVNLKLEKAKADLANENVKAFLKTLRFAEGTLGDDGYNTTYGYEKFKNTTDHPVITGEWIGKKLPDSWCIKAGYTPPCFSTAAGAYQMTKRTWSNLKKSLNLSDFSRENQDLAAVAILRDAGAIENIKGGKISDAITKVSGTWASLPGSSSGQPQHSMDDLLSKFEQYNKGGT